MPLTPADENRRDRLVKAAQVLRDNKRGDLADEVDYVLSGPGAAFVKRVADDKLGAKSTLSTKLDGALWDEILPQLHVNDDDPSKSLRDKDERTLTQIVEGGFQDFLAGTFEVQLSSRQARGTATTSRLTVSPGHNLSGAVSTRCREMRDEKREQKTSSGRGLFVSTVAAHAIYRHFQVGPYASDAGA